MPDKPRRSRVGWRDMLREEDDDIVPGMPFHDHRPPRWIVRALAGVTITLLLVIAAVAVAGVFIWQQQLYVQGRGEYRDQESARLEEMIRVRMCSLLDALPVDPLLNEARRINNCGPGIPIEELPSELQQRIESGYVAPLPQEEDPPQVPDRPAGAPARAEEPRQVLPEAEEPRQAVPEAEEPRQAVPEAEEPIIVDLDPVTEPVCDLLGVCL